MSNLKKLLHGFGVIALIVFALSGCAQKKFVQETRLQSVDCRLCHALGGAGAQGATDFSSIYADPKSHHPVGVTYPLGTQSRSAFNAPNGHAEGVIFFDKNGNGRPESDEARLFGETGEFKIECSSCHKSHGEPRSTGLSGLNYLRGSNVDSALCVTCHNN